MKDRITSPLFDSFENEALTKTPVCKWCNRKLHGPVYAYSHTGGWAVPGMDGKWWLYISCGCGYDWALWKLGVPGNYVPGERG